jgi:hypothetical protein
MTATGVAAPPRLHFLGALPELPRTRLVTAPAWIGRHLP